ncbi:MAG: glycoside hydrolase family 3 protein [Deltaproteobacteria bacterium]|nr:glycoside hydrolase family 3 protein [Deltaproteobacteria bacterium]
MKNLGQLLIVGFEGTSPQDSSVKILLKQIREAEVGGVILFGHNIISPRQVRDLTLALAQAAPADLPLLIAIDQEGGSVQRLQAKKGFRDYLTPHEIGQRLRPEEAQTYYLELALELRKFGFNLNFAPCVDLDLACPVISGLGRSFGDDTAKVVAFADALVNAHHEAGVLTCLKHFPGHGSAQKDSHLGMVDITDVWTERECEPFRILIDKGSADMVMTAHLMHQSFDDAPLSLSSALIRPILRETFHFDGVVIVDDLHMGAIQEQYRDPTTVIDKALRAGNDMVLFSKNPQAAPRIAKFAANPDLPSFFRASVLELLEKGSLSEADLEASLQRVRKLKQRIF